jgi:hypothetical protein
MWEISAFCWFYYKNSEQNFGKVLQWEMFVHFLRFYNVYIYGSVICKYGYWLPLEWYCIFLEAGSADSISAIVSKRNGKTNNNSFCFVSVSDAFRRYWVVQLKTRRHMEKFSLMYYFGASIFTEKLVGIITIKLYCLTDLWNIPLFNDKSVDICISSGQVRTGCFRSVICKQQ